MKSPASILLALGISVAALVAVQCRSSVLWSEPTATATTAIGSASGGRGGSSGRGGAGGAGGNCAPFDNSVEVCAGGGPGATTSTRLALGSNHSCAIVEGGVACWGDNSHGQLGDGTTAERHAPTKVVGLAGTLVQIAAGGDHTCVNGGSKLWCWGKNDHGQLGDGTTADRNAPVQVPLPIYVDRVAAGGAHTCASGSGGQPNVAGLYCWGDNSFGQLGDGTTIERHAPTKVLAAGSDHIALGGAHTCAGGACWGKNDAGQLGLGFADAQPHPMPAPVPGLGPYSIVFALGDRHSCAATSGAVYCWGDNSFGQLGDGTTMNRAAPGKAIDADAPQIAVGSSHGCFRSEFGTPLYCWGRNAAGELGDGTTENQTTAEQPLPGLCWADAGEIAAGGHHTCMVERSGLNCWGDNSHGQLGDGTTTDRSSPVKVAF